MTDQQEHKHSLDDIPAWVLPSIRQCIRSVRDEDRFLHLTMKGLHQLTVYPDILGLLHETDSVEGEHTPPSQAAIDAAKEDAQWVEEETKHGHPLLHRHAVVGIWSALEVLCEDLVVSWVQNRSDAWELEPVRTLRVQVGVYHNLGARERAQYVVRELQHSLKTELKSGLGRFEPLLNLFGLMPQVGANLRRAIHELWQVRNNVVHSGGVADDQLLEACPWLGFKLGKPYQINHTLYGWYRLGADRLAERIASKALQALGFEGCTCQGREEIDPRPDAPVSSE